MRKCGRRLHGHPKNLIFEGCCCVWPFRAVLPCKPRLADHRLLGSDILQCNSGHPLGTSFVPYDVLCSREMHPRSPFPCLGSNTHHIRGWAMGRFRVWPCKTLTHRQEPGMPWISCYCNLRAKEETHQAPQQSPHPLKRHFSTSRTIPLQNTGSSCSAARTRTCKDKTK